MGYDLVIKNGHVIDGTGRTRFKTTVYVEEGKIACLQGMLICMNREDSPGLHPR